MKFGENCEMAGPRVLDHHTRELESAYRNNPNNDSHVALKIYRRCFSLLLDDATNATKIGIGNAAKYTITPKRHSGMGLTEAAMEAATVGACPGVNQK